MGVFLAPGAPPVRPGSIPGIEKALLAEEVILDPSLCGKTAVLIGAGLTGLECAEMVLERGCRLTIVEMNPTAGQGIFGVVLNDIMSRIQPYNPAVLTSHMLNAVEDGDRKSTRLNSSH